MWSINMSGTFILFLFVSVIYHGQGSDVITSVGLVSGYLKTSYGGKPYSAFEGIPYAKPPVGNLRFEEAQPADPWIGKWNATTSHECIQTDISKKIIGLEDCLYLNVYVPREQPLSLEELSVIVHIHGGGFKVGSPHSYTAADYLMDKNVIFVTFNYRLGVFGFLSTGDEVVPGNLGLKDQLLALKWVKDNIKYFGGNPNSITLTGFSAGGASSHLHYLSPKSRGLFNRGVSHSGTALNLWSTKPVDSVVTKAKGISRALGCPVESSREMVDCLKQRPALDLLKKSIESEDDLLAMDFVPVVDGDFLPKAPLDILMDKNLPDIPWIFSNTAEDGIMPSGLFAEKFDEVNEGWTKMAPHILLFSQTQPQSDWEQISQTIKNYYIGTDEKISASTYRQLVKLFTDRYFITEAERAAKLQSKAVKSSVYYYFYNYRTTATFSDLDFPNLKPEFKGISHGDDILHLYGEIFPNRQLSESDKQIKETLLDILVSFAGTGTPKVENVTWKPTKHNELAFLNITSPSEISVNTQKTISHINFWNKLNLENLKQEQKDEL
ncbi:unnamed protein product [Brassicogethes aeneus]|uniref:Carboxylic ester hydrolase n=1 Tax=Brassicogethes aeneus TaxID=1431903 RepID=A0A9P0BDN7_BRAAE|nr:unnamed protein product [Brassicogethes aeneus]